MSKNKVLIIIMAAVLTTAACTIDSDYTWEISQKIQADQNSDNNTQTPEKKIYHIDFLVMENSTPIPDAQVDINGLSMIKTDSLGRTDLDMEEGSYTCDIKAEGYKDVNDYIFIANEDKQVTIKLHKYREIIFTVTDGGNPIENAVVSIGNDSELNTNISGTATFALIDGNYNYSVVASGYKSINSTDLEVNGDMGIPVNLEVLYEIEFTVTDNSTSLPISGALITSSDETGVTDADGQVTLFLTSGNQPFVIEKEGYYNYSSCINVSGNMSVSPKMNPSS